MTGPDALSRQGDERRCWPVHTAAQLPLVPGWRLQLRGCQRRRDQAVLPSPLPFVGMLRAARSRPAGFRARGRRDRRQGRAGAGAARGAAVVGRVLCRGARSGLGHQQASLCSGWAAGLRSEAASGGAALACSAWAMLGSGWGSDAVDRAASGTAAPARTAWAASSFCRRRSRSRFAFSKFLALHAGRGKACCRHTRRL